MKFHNLQDLWVWFDDDVPVAFQLAYGKYRDEHAIGWKAGKGFVHHVTADVVNRFLTMSQEVPQDIVDSVLARLREHPALRDGEED